ncbi:alpha/beta hydrolase, partial [Mycobacterium sp.]|uniref:alpha/beta fold hydrolase n=1 Tax=Mycobacterium sp. TaxID=1785 RepID=UPI002CB5F66F
AVYEAVARHQARRDFKVTGVLVDIGGRRLHLDCRGQGSPTVVFEAGLDTLGALSWSAVHEAVAGSTRACAYDRAGMMWSDPREGKADAQAIAVDLRAGLRAAHEPPPFVMVGHSLGGPYVMTFTRNFPDEVAGLVFVDASHPDQELRMKRILGRELKPSDTLFKVASALAWMGVPRLIWPKGEPEPASAAVQAAALAYGPTSLPAALAEEEAIDDTFREAGMLRRLGDRPIVVLTGMKPFPPDALKAMKLSAQQGALLQKDWLAMHDEEASWSTRSTHRQVADSSHYIQFDRPDEVIAAVRQVVEAVRAESVRTDSSR